MRRSPILLALLAMGLMAALSGCESLFSDSAEFADREALLAEYGGFDTSDEMEAFGYPDLAASYAEEPDFDDEMEWHPDVREAGSRPGASKYFLRVVWGNIHRPDSTDGVQTADCPVTDWSGSLETSGGFVTVRRLIRFELPSDHMVRPRPGPQTVSWVSHTMPHVDGILFHIVDVPDAGEHVSINSVTITTPLYTAEIPFAELDGYREFIEIDECNKISIIATRDECSRCPSGFLEGGWIAETDTSGYFRGGWLACDGRPAGYLRGRYTVRDGKRVLHGKWITVSGRFGGLIKGTWEPAAGDGGPDGFFEARWVDQAFIARGVLKGHYHICPEGGAGFFHGRWKRICR